jgi:hypothetical protein
MRASRLALVAAVLAIPSAVYSQDNGLVNGRVGSDLSTSPMQSNPSMGATGPYHRPLEPGHRAGFAGVTMPGQLFPKLCLSSQDRMGAVPPSSMATA